MKKPLSVMQMVCISLVSILCCFYPDSLPDSSAAQSFAPGTQPKESYSNKKQFLNTVSGSYKDAETWFLNNVRDKGIFIYLYDPYTDSYADKNNMVRQLMSSRLLADLALDNPSLGSVHKKNLRFIFENWYREDNAGRGYIFYDNKSKLGANAMALRTLSYSPFFEIYSIQAKKIADGILSLMDDKGAFEPWFIAPNYKYNRDYFLTFYSGEAILGLVEYAIKSGQKEYLRAAIKAQEYYLIKYVDDLEQNYYPSYVPWHTLSLTKLYKLTQRDKYAGAVLRLNDELLKLQDTTKFIGRFHKPEFMRYGKPHSSSDGIYTESLAYALDIAKQKNDLVHQARYDRAIRLSVINLTKLQYTERYSFAAEIKEKAQGAFRNDNGDRRIRIDCTQHIMDAYRKILTEYRDFPKTFSDE
jgi:hypothetical protein